jgi:hypothetical protein
MNKCIKELALTCGAWHQVYDQKEFMLDSNFDVGKFAESIVRDTIKLLQQEWYDLNNAPPVGGESARDVGIRVGRKIEVIALMSKVSKHFGVEE